MNGAGLGIVGILIVVLIAVSIGAQEMDNQKTAMIYDLKGQRQVLIDTAEEALGQRDGERVRAETLEKQNIELALQLDEKEILVANQQDEIERLTQEIAQKEAEIAGLQSIPVTGRPDSRVVPVGVYREPETVVRINIPGVGTCLVSKSGTKKNLLTIVFVLSGLVLVGGSGYVAYQSDADRKITVRMSREQLKDFVRYQRRR